MTKAACLLISAPLLWSASALAASPLPSLPGAPVGPTAPAGPPEAPAGTPAGTPAATAPGASGPGGPTAPQEREPARRGVVQVELGGRPIALGAVLSKDGRVLTSLSGLGASESLELRYADGTVVKAKVGHKDKGWDLALLVPQSGRWADGLAPAVAEPSAGELKAFLPAKTGKLAQTNVEYKGRIDARSKEGDPLRAALDLGFKTSPAVPGAPVLDGTGSVVGIVVRACKDAIAPDAAKDAKGESKPDKPAAKAAAPACASLTVGAPVYALRTFLMKTPASAAMPAPWLGLGGASSEAGNVRGVRVVGLAPGSPAEKAGLKAGDGADTIVAVDGQPVETPEQLADLIAGRAIGQSVKLLVYAGGRFRDVAAILRAAP